MHACPNCSCKLKFVDVAKAVNPARIKCSGCGQQIAVSAPYAIAGGVVAAALSLALVGLGLYADVPGALVLVAMVAAGLAVEGTYYYLIVNGTIETRALPAASVR